MKLSLVLSVAGHAAALLSLLGLAAEVGPPPQLPVLAGVAVVFSRPAPAPQPPPQPIAEPPVPPLPPPPPPKPEPIVPPPRPIPPPPAQVAAVPVPPRKPAVRRVVHRPPRPPTPAAEPEPPPPAVANPGPPVPAPAAPPAAVPGPDPAVRYVAMISAWLERHKHYPDTARARGEEGRASLRFRVDRFGSVLGYTVLASTGYADLDAGIADMMRGARLPPFPSGMTGSQIDVSVTIRFNLTR